MSAEAIIKTRCPICSAKYRVPSTAVGHRARCVQCKATFRVSQVKSSRLCPPTEDDILAWLSEGRDDDHLDYEDHPKDHRSDLEKRQAAEQGTSSATSRPPSHASSALTRTDRLTHIDAQQGGKILQFRKTG